MSEKCEARQFGLRRAQQRLQTLHQAGLVKRWRYATETGGAAPHYFKLSRQGLTAVFGPDALAPRKRFFDPVSISLQSHTRAIADFLVHLHVAAHQSGIAVADVVPENGLKLATPLGALVPDGTFDLLLPDGRRFHYFLEVDCSTEPIRSKSLDAWQRRVRRYEALRQQTAEPFRVLVLTVVGEKRLESILQCVAATIVRGDRSLFYGAVLREFLAEPDAAVAHVFRNHRSHPASLSLPPPSDGRAVKRTLATLLPWTSLRVGSPPELVGRSAGRPPPPPRPPVTPGIPGLGGNAAPPPPAGPGQ